MAKLDIDSEAYYWLDRLGTDPDAPGEVLKIAARYLRDYEPMPGHFAGHLADAFEAAMAKPLDMQGSALLRELGFTQGHRRKSADWHAVGCFMSRLIDEGESQNEAATSAAVHFEISESTAKRSHRAFLENLRKSMERSRQKYELLNPDWEELEREEREFRELEESEE